MLALTTDQLTSIGGEVLTLCTCWQLSRADGIAFLVTDHDQPVSLDGFLYSPAGGFNSTAIHRDSSMKNRNREFSGVLEIEAITNADLKAGLYRDQQVIEFLVDWEHPERGAIYQNVYWIENTTYTGETWNISLLGMTGWLRREVGDRYDRICRFSVGDDMCGVDVVGLSQNGTVASIVSGKLAFTATGLTQPDGYFTDGLLTWTSGLNSSLPFEVQTWASSTITSWLQTPYPIQVGDTFNVQPGCDRLVNTCINRFNNIARNGSFRYMPGTDRMLSTPT